MCITLRACTQPLFYVSVLGECQTHTWRALCVWHSRWRGHPDLVGRQRKHAYYGGNKHLILDDVQIEGTAIDGPGVET